VAPDVRDTVVDFLRALHERTELPWMRLCGWLGLGRQKLHDWRDRYGKVNEHNAWIPRDHWLLPEEEQVIVEFHDQHPLEGYRRLTFMMIDQNVVACSPSSVYRVLHRAGRLDRWNKKRSKKGTGFVQPLRPHEHWHIDIAHLNLCGTFYYMCSILDGASRTILHWEVRESMKEVDVECVLQRARELYPDARPRIISDNGPQFIAGDFKEFIRLCGMTHVRTSVNYPQANGKIERYHRTCKHDAIRPAAPQTLGEALRIVERFVEHYNRVRLHSALGYIAPLDFMAGRKKQILEQRDRRIEAARTLRAQRRAILRDAALPSLSSPPEAPCA
jgi:hypothetical protein